VRSSALVRGDVQIRSSCGPGADAFCGFGLKRGLRSADRTRRGADRGDDRLSGRDRDERAEEAGAEELLTNPGQR
jgi:hypothetical protein